MEFTPYGRLNNGLAALCLLLVLGWGGRKAEKEGKGAALSVVKELSLSGCCAGWDAPEAEKVQWLTWPSSEQHSTEGVEVVLVGAVLRCKGSNWTCAQQHMGDTNTHILQGILSVRGKSLRSQERAETLVRKGLQWACTRSQGAEAQRMRCRCYLGPAILSTVGRTGFVVHGVTKGMHAARRPQHNKHTHACTRAHTLHTRARAHSHTYLPPICLLLMGMPSPLQVLRQSAGPTAPHGPHCSQRHTGLASRDGQPVQQLLSSKRSGHQVHSQAVALGGLHLRMRRWSWQMGAAQNKDVFAARDLASRGAQLDPDTRGDRSCA
eukprot:1119215-Pelagomonas_calceolata.AAC.1